MRDDSPRDKTLENNTIFKFTTESVRARVRQPPWLSIQIFPSFRHGTRSKFFFFSDALPENGWISPHWQMAPRIRYILYSENQAIPRLSSTQIVRLSQRRPVMGCRDYSSRLRACSFITGKKAAIKRSS